MEQERRVRKKGKGTRDKAKTVPSMKQKVNNAGGLIAAGGTGRPNVFELVVGGKPRSVREEA